jgi:hypothetical protein
MLAAVNLGAIAPGATLYRFETAGSFISSIYQVNYVRGPIPTDTTERTYYTGDGAPKVTDNSFVVRQLGVPKPGAAPLVGVIASTAYTEAIAATAMGLKTSEFTSLIWANATLGYVGLEVGDYSPHFVVSTEPWEFRFVIAGALVSGTFVPTNPLHSALISAEFGFFTETVGPTTTGYVPVNLRGQTVTFDAGLAADLSAIANPTDSLGIIKLLSASQVTAITTDLADSLKAANATRDAAIGRLKLIKNEFVLIANGGASATVAANKAEMTAFYARVDVASDITAAILQAAESIANALDGYSVDYNGL